MKKLILLFVTLSIFTNTKAQDDPNVGFYVDGVKVTELTCYSFKSLVVVLPFNKAYSNFDRFMLYTDTKNEFTSTYTISKGKILSTVKKDYIVLTLFDGQGQVSALGRAYSYGQMDCENGLTRGALAYFMSKSEDDLSIALWGQTISGYAENYDADCNCVKKEATYDQEILVKGVSVALKNRSKKKGFMKSPCSFEVDISQPCTVEGTKVDFNTLGKTTTNTTNNSTPLEKTTAPAKTETPGKTTATTSSTKTNTNTITNASMVKPLDKAKPGYFSEKDGAIITREGYKKGNEVMIGEVRSYTDEGKLKSIHTYSNDVLTGFAATFYENGQVELIGNYKEGEKDGEWKEYNDAGKLLSTKKYLNGEVQD